jgi:hypothetical protein
MLSLRGVGQGLVFCGVILGLDFAGMGGEVGAIGGTLAIVVMVLGLVLIRKAKPKS